uniref:Uncharacterized protein n=1 Tax=Desulfovibrio sp. U5L TaxID=596152 RepID=I2Q7R3_9BACT
MLLLRFDKIDVSSLCKIYFTYIVIFMGKNIC